MFPIYHSTTLPTVIYNACREGWWSDIYTECYSISFLFLFFFHQSSLYPIKIFAKCFYLLVCILFSAPTLSELKLIIFNFLNFRELSLYQWSWRRSNRLYIHSLVQLCSKFKACRFTDIVIGLVCVDR